MAKISVTGNATDTPELRYTPSGTAVANVGVAENRRRKVDGQWQDDDTTFYRVTVWRQMAEHVAESIRKGQRINVIGDFKARQYETREGEKRTSVEITADAIGHDLKFATARATRTDIRGQDMGGGYGSWESGGGDDPDSEPPF